MFKTLPIKKFDNAYLLIKDKYSVTAKDVYIVVDSNSSYHRGGFTYGCYGSKLLLQKNQDLGLILSLSAHSYRQITKSIVLLDELVHITKHNNYSEYSWTFIIYKVTRDDMNIFPEITVESIESLLSFLGKSRSDIRPVRLNGEGAFSE